ncbi:MAG: heterodisulfide reductase-related iron-sulfur binding cluster, partial [Pseudomonadota bacterium]
LRPYGGPPDAEITPRSVVLLADTFNRYFEPENLEAAETVLTAGGYRVHTPGAADGNRPLCCGRTLLAAGLVDEARAEAQRTVQALLPYVERGIPVVGLEPSCLLTLRDEFMAMLPGDETQRVASSSHLFEEFVSTQAQEGELALPLKAPAKRVLLHGHCHQKAFDLMSSVEHTLRLIPEMEVELISSSCCGMAGAFGYGKETFSVSQQMAELDVLPAVRGADSDTLIIADGTSCRHQISDLAGRSALHVARLLEMALNPS